MDLSTQRAALLDLTGKLLGVPCMWKDSRRKYGATGVIALLTLDVAARVGAADEIRTTYDVNQPLGQELLDTINGTRRATFSVQVVSYDQRDTRTALGYLEQLRTGLAGQYAQTALQAVNVAVWDSAQVFPNNAPTDEHISSIATLDVTLGLVINQTDTLYVAGVATPQRYPYIQHVQVTDQDNNQQWTTDGPP